jgi:hypothetical protein
MRESENSIKEMFDREVDDKARACWENFFTKTFPPDATDAKSYMAARQMELYVPFARKLFGLNQTATRPGFITEASFYTTPQEYIGSEYDINRILVFDAETQDAVRYSLDHKNDKQRILLDPKEGLLSRELLHSTTKSFCTGEMVKFSFSTEGKKTNRGQVLGWYIIKDTTTSKLHYEIHSRWIERCPIHRKKPGAKAAQAAVQESNNDQDNMFQGNEDKGQDADNILLGSDDDSVCDFNSLLEDEGRAEEPKNDGGGGRGRKRTRKPQVQVENGNISSHRSGRVQG